MIEIADRCIVIDGEPRLLISGEIHYFRLDRADWQDRLDAARDAGLNTIASYIPWLIHERENGEIDLDGHTNPNRDLGAFIDLVHENGFHFIARPGPFIMAELKNEGIPYRIYTDHPEAVPVGWDGKPAPTRTLDYLAPAFLAECRTWYSHVIPVIAERIHPRGPVIGLQLDNEIGMLAWVSNAPDLTDHAIADFWRWLRARDGDSAVDAAYPFAASDPAAIRSPQPEWTGRFHQDLGHFMRNRFARYAATLRGYAEEFGARDIPFIINIHGTEAGGGEPFPIGISQLYESYTQAPGYLAGSDHYLGRLAFNNLPDLYLMNAFMAAVNRPEQPLTSMEFEAGAGDYGSSFDGRNEPADTDFKIRMSLAQDNRLLNYYLFTGGINERMERQYHDGNDRISFTGERHGTGAPVNPEGERSYTFPRLARANTAALAIGDKLATMEEEHDAFDLAFIPDYWMTEYRYPGTPQIQEKVDALRMTRFGGPNRITARSLLLNTYRFGAIDLQRAGALTPGRALVVNAGLAMAPEIQQRLVDHASNGAGIFIHGQLPRFDMTGAPCTILIDALGLEYRTMRQQTHRYYLSIASHGIAAPRAELSIGWAQTFAADDRAIFTVYDTDEACGFDIPLGAGRMIVVTSTLPGELDFFHRVMRELGVTRGLMHDAAHHGIFLTSQRNDDGERLIHLLNLDAFDKAPVITDGGVPFAEGRPVTLRSRDGVMLPVEMMVTDGVEISWSTAEIARRGDDGITLRIEGPSALLIRTDREIAVPGATIDRRADGSLLLSTESAGALRMTWGR